MSFCRVEPGEVGETVRTAEERSRKSVPDLINLQTQDQSYRQLKSLIDAPNTAILFGARGIALADAPVPFFSAFADLP